MANNGVPILGQTEERKTHNFSSPGVMVVWLEADTMVGSAMCSYRHCMTVGQKTQAEFFQKMAQEFEHFRNSWLQEDMLRIKIAAPSDFPPH